MQIQKITFTPTNKKQQINNNQINSQKYTTPLTKQNFDKVDYSQIAFGAIYNVKPKTANIEAAKNKLLKQINELLQTEIKDTDSADLFAYALKKLILGFRANIKQQVSLLTQMENLSENKALNAQQKYEESNKILKEYNRLRKNLFKPEKPKNQPKTDERWDYQLLNKFKTAIEEGNFDFEQIFKDHYKKLNGIYTIEELNKYFPQIKTPTKPEEVIAKKIEESFTRDLYEGIQNKVHNSDELLDYLDNPLKNSIIETIKKYNIDPVAFLKKIAEPTIIRIIDRFQKTKEKGLSIIPEYKKDNNPKVSELDIKLLFSNFDNFVLHTIKQQILEGKKLNEIEYGKTEKKIKLSELKGSEYKFEKIPDKIKSFIKIAKQIDLAQKDYEHFDIQDFRNRLNYFANSEIGNNEEILKNIIDFDNCNFTPEDNKNLILFLRKLDELQEGKIQEKEITDALKDLTPKGTIELNEIERKKNEEKLKIMHEKIATLNNLKKEFDNAINILYANNLTNMALACSKHRPKNLEESENAKFLIDLISKNLQKDNKIIDKNKLEQNILRWDTFTYYKENPISVDVFDKAVQFGQKSDGTVDIDKAGQYLVNSGIVETYPESEKYSRNPEILKKVIEKSPTNEDAVKSLCKFDDYQDLSPEDKKQITKLIDIFDIKNNVEKSILKNIIENEYISVDTQILTKIGNDYIPATIGAKAKQQIIEKYKYPLCLPYLKGFEEALTSFAKEWGDSGIKNTGKNNNTAKYKMELKITGHNDRLFSSNNNYYFDIFSDKGLH